SDRVDEPLPSTFGQIQAPNLLRDFQPRAPYSPFQLRELFALLTMTLFLFGAKFLEFLQRLPGELGNVLNAFDGPGAILLGLVFVAGEFGLFRERNGVANVETMALEVFTDSYYFAHSNRRTRDRFLCL